MPRLFAMPDRQPLTNAMIGGSALWPAFDQRAQAVVVVPAGRAAAEVHSKTGEPTGRVFAVDLGVDVAVERPACDSAAGVPRQDAPPGAEISAPASLRLRLRSAPCATTRSGMSGTTNRPLGF